MDTSTERSAGPTEDNFAHLSDDNVDHLFDDNVDHLFDEETVVNDPFTNSSVGGSYNSCSASHRPETGDHGENDMLNQFCTMCSQSLPTHDPKCPFLKPCDGCQWIYWEHDQSCSLRPCEYCKGPVFQHHVYCLLKSPKPCECGQPCGQEQPTDEPFAHMAAGLVGPEIDLTTETPRISPSMSHSAPCQSMNVTTASPLVHGFDPSSQNATTEVHNIPHEDFHGFNHGFAQQSNEHYTQPYAQSHAQDPNLQSSYLTTEQSVNGASAHSHIYAPEASVFHANASTQGMTSSWPNPVLGEPSNAMETGIDPTAPYNGLNAWHPFSPTTSSALAHEWQPDAQSHATNPNAIPTTANIAPAAYSGGIGDIAQVRTSQDASSTNGVTASPVLQSRYSLPRETETGYTMPPDPSIMHPPYFVDIESADRWEKQQVIYWRMSIVNDDWKDIDVPKYQDQLVKAIQESGKVVEEDGAYGIHRSEETLAKILKTIKRDPRLPYRRAIQVIKAAIKLHEKGVKVQAGFTALTKPELETKATKEGSYHLEQGMTCSERIEEIIRHVRENKQFAWDVVQKGPYPKKAFTDMAHAPKTYRKKKDTNKKVNKTKKDNKEKMAEELARVEKKVVDGNHSSDQGLNNGANVSLPNTSSRTKAKPKPRPEARSVTTEQAMQPPPANPDPQPAPASAPGEVIQDPQNHNATGSSPLHVAESGPPGPYMGPKTGKRKAHDNPDASDPPTKRSRGNY